MEVVGSGEAACLDETVAFAIQRVSERGALGREAATPAARLSPRIAQAVTLAARSFPQSL